MMRSLIVVLLLAVAGLFGQPGLAAPSGDEAVASGHAWLALVDHDKFGESWTTASNLFRGKVDQEKWAEQVGAARAAFGTLKSRTVRGVTLTKTLPGAPDGDYAVIRFQSVFEKKAEASETLVLTLESEYWAMTGYLIR